MITYQHGNTTLILPYQYKVKIGPISNSYGAKSKIECLHWCSAHEMIHAGQIALLRRLFGQSPIW